MLYNFHILLINSSFSSPDAIADYDAVLTEAGDYTEKYNLAKEIIARFNPLEGIGEFREGRKRRGTRG